MSRTTAGGLWVYWCVQLIAGCRVGYDWLGAEPGSLGSGGGGFVGSGAQAGFSSAGSAPEAGAPGSSGGAAGDGSAEGGAPPVGGTGAASAGAPAVDPCGGCPPGEGCVAGSCVPGQRVFVTAATFNTDFGGVTGGDVICQAAADAAGLGGAWFAWLSDGTTWPSARFAQATGPYLLVDGTVVANDWADLVDGSLAHSIDRDEAGQLVVLREVWTGTTASGDPTGNDCNDWKKQTANPQRADQGLTTETGAGWTAVYLQFCDRANVSLYCFEQ